MEKSSHPGQSAGDCLYNVKGLEATEVGVLKMVNRMLCVLHYNLKKESLHPGPASGWNLTQKCRGAGSILYASSSSEWEGILPDDPERSFVFLHGSGCGSLCAVSACQSVNGILFIGVGNLGPWPAPHLVQAFLDESGYMNLTKICFLK